MIEWYVQGKKQEEKRRKKMKSEINLFFLYTLALTSQQRTYYYYSRQESRKARGGWGRRSFRVYQFTTYWCNTLCIYRLEKLHICSIYCTHIVLVFYPLSLFCLSNALVADVFLTRCLGVENQGDNETVKTQNFGKNQDQNLCKQQGNKG